MALEGMALKWKAKVSYSSVTVVGVDAAEGKEDARYRITCNNIQNTAAAMNLVRVMRAFGINTDTVEGWPEAVAKQPLLAAPVQSEVKPSLAGVHVTAFMLAQNWWWVGTYDAIMAGSDLRWEQATVTDVAKGNVRMDRLAIENGGELKVRHRWIGGAVLTRLAKIAA